MPKCAFMLAYRAVPVRFFSAEYGMCWCVFGSRYLEKRDHTV